jgi:deoxyribonuclease-4
MTEGRLGPGPRPDHGPAPSRTPNGKRGGKGGSKSPPRSSGSRPPGGAPRSRHKTNLLLGSHLSISGGHHNAVDEAAGLRMEALQIFTRNSNQWAAKPIEPEERERWTESLGRHPLVTMVHGSYLINLASPDETLYRRSRQAFLDETRRCLDLGIPYLVFHPGAHMGEGEAKGLARIVRALDWTLRRIDGAPLTLLLENTAGQGTVLGSRFEQLAWIRDRVRDPGRVQVCLDTCHLFAAGYDLRTDAGYAEVMGALDAVLGANVVRAFHLNDAKRELGSRADRHEHIGRGHLGARAFQLLLHDRRFSGVPMVLETPKDNDMDRKNLALLRRLAARPL